jgi:LmbE family N-acetylglucosaminyl deacetylase
VSQLAHPDSALDAVPFATLIEDIDRVVARVRPETVYVVHRGDVHSDHVLVHLATMSVLKSFRMSCLGVRRVLAYETLSSTDAASVVQPAFLPTVFSDISGFLEAKCRLMECYDSELQGRWMPRTSSALTALARLRGASVGVEHAEAFMLLRELS